MDIESTLAETSSTIEHFSQLLERETAAARAMELDEIGTLGQRKAELGQRLDQLLAMLRQNKASVTVVTEARPEVKARLVEQWDNFTRLAIDNMRALKNAEENTRRVIDVIVGAAREQQQQAVVGYGRPNARGMMGKAPSSMSVAFSASL